MPLDLAAGAPPIVLSRNYIGIASEDASDLVASTGQTLIHRIYGMDPTAKWSSSGSDDTITETITVGLYKGSVLTSRSIDFLAFLNINWKNFDVYYSNDNGATYTLVPSTDYGVGVANYASADLIINPTAFAANKLRIRIYKTQTANQDKTIGVCVAALSTFSAQRMAEYRPTRKAMRKDLTLADGTVDYTYIYWSDNSYELYGAEAGWVNLTSAQRTSLRDMATQVDPFLWYPEPGDLNREIHQCVVVPETFEEEYSTTYKGGGWDIRLEVQEVGGA